MLQIDGSALPANNGNTTRGTFWASANLIAGWGSIVEFSLHLAGAPSWLLRERAGGSGLCPNKYGERSGCYGCVPTVTVHEVRTLSPQIAPGACECAG